MAKVGETEVYTAGGWQVVSLYDPADFDYAPVEIALGDGTWGVPYLTSPAEADTPFEIYTQSNGWMGINQAGFQTIDDYERGNLNPYCVPPASGDTPVATARAARSGDYGLEMVGFNQIAATPNTGNLSPPVPGDTWQVWMRIPGSESGNDEQYHHHWAVQGTGDCDTTDDISHYYDAMVNCHVSDTSESGSLHLRANNSGGTLSSWTGSGQVFPTDTWFYLEIDWDDTTSPNTLTIQVFDQNDSALTNAVSAQDDSWTAVDNQGFGFRCSSPVSDSRGAVDFDNVRHVPA